MLEKVMLGVTALVVLGAVYMFRDSWTPQIKSAFDMSEPTPVAHTTTPAPDPKATKKEHTHHAARRVEKADILPPAPPPDTVRLAIAKPPVPDVQVVPSGMVRKDVIDQFGFPYSSASWRESKVQYEEFIYRDSKKSEAVLMRNGKVISCRLDNPTARITSGEDITVQW